MNSASVKNYAITLLALAATVMCVFFTLQVRTTSAQVGAALEQITQTAKQAKLAAFEAQAAAKSARDEWESRDYQRARLNTLRLGESAQITLAQINHDLLPALVKTTNQAQALIGNTDQSINNDLLPQITRTSRNLADLAAVFKADEQQVAAELVKSIQAGQATADQVNALLRSDQIPAILANLNTSSGELAKTSANVAAMTDRWPEMATEINRILKTGRQWQRPVMLAGLLAQLARIFF